VIAQSFELFVNGTLMRGLGLHHNIADAEFLGEAYTEAHFRLYSIGDVHPGMYRLSATETGGISVPGELYRVTAAQWARIEAGEPPHLYRGEITLINGRRVWGILYPRDQAEQSGRDITVYGGWRTYLQYHQQATDMRTPNPPKPLYID